MVFDSNTEKSLKLSWRIEHNKAQCGKEQIHIKIVKLYKVEDI